MSPPILNIMDLAVKQSYELFGIVGNMDIVGNMGVVL